MNIHIFGHSICTRARTDRYESKDPDTFVDILIKKYKIPEYCIHVCPEGSEERILYFLKKVKEIDIALIFHGGPSHFFIPGLTRDMHKVNEDYWDKEKFLLSESPYTVLDKQQPDDVINRKIPVNAFKSHYDSYMKYFFTPQLNRNRHYGALLQIDQFLKYKNIPSIHCILKDTLPTWYDLSSGVVDDDLAKYQNKDHVYSCSYNQSANCISKEGNIKIAEILSRYIDKLIVQTFNITQD